MRPHTLNGVYPGGNFQVAWRDGERVFCRGLRPGGDGDQTSVLLVLSAAEHPSASILDSLAHEYGLKDELDRAWAVRPLELVRSDGRAMLVLEDPGGEPLDQPLGSAMKIGDFLHLAVGIASVVGKLHQRGLVHRDIKPANVLVNRATGTVKLTGFGIASRLTRERQPSEPPETIAGTFAYMAPEQTGRMDRSIDSRSDLYSLGVTLYRMLTGSLPFTTSDPVEWVHCHIAKKPLSPAQRLPNVPAVLSAIVMKLLAKTAEDRYQTAGGLESDLGRCLAEWETHRRIDDFRLGEHDIPDRLLIPEKLYGREREVETLLATFNRVVASGAPELVLVSGHPGVGKSSVVHELHRALVLRRGLFASGKFDRYKRDIPYSTVAQAFQSLIRGLLAKSEADLAAWRDTLREALGPNGRLMIDLVPELKLVIWEQPLVAELPPQQAQGRFHFVFRRFIGVFAKPEHPLALFLDDLQWVDAATLDLLKDLLAQPDARHLLIIGAYRDNEVDPAHPLTRKLDAIRQAGAMVQEIRLEPLAPEDVGQLVADALHCEPTHCAPLAQLAHEKTAGNPFFMIQFLHALADKGLLTLEHERARWSWDLDRIRAMGDTDNVVDLVVSKLNQLPVDAQKALQVLACLGNSADVKMLSLVHGTSAEQVHADLREAVRQELVERLGGAYKFVHDRVREAAYSLITEEQREEVHLQTGRLLAAHTPAEKQVGEIFEIVNQLNRGAALVTSRDERVQLAELNLIAAKRAKSSAAYASALRYSTAGVALLTDDCRDDRRELIFALELLRAECEFLTGELALAEERLAALAGRATNTVERATVACLHMDVHTTLGRNSDAVAVGLDYFRHLGIEWSAHPTEEEARRECDRMWSQLGERTIENLIELPLVNDAASLATFDVLIKLGAPALFTDVNLYCLTACRGVNLSLECGNCDASCAAYVRLGMTAGPCFGDYQAGCRFARLGYELTERRGLKRFQARTYQNFGNVLPWTKHVKTGRDLVRRAVASANQVGDLTIAAFSCSHLITNMLAAGDPLIEVQREAERSRVFVQNARFGFFTDIIAAKLALVRMLRGLSRRFGSLDSDEFDEVHIVQRLSGSPNLAIAECWYWIRKLQACFLAGDHATAVKAASEAQRLLWTSPSMFESAEYHFYGALSRAAFRDAAPAEQRQQHVEALVAHHRQLEIWATNCPENFKNRAALVGAEIARIEGRDLDAMRLYEQAIRSARENGFIHNEAIAYEIAARFYAARDFEEIADTYFRQARYGYLRWGAEGKVRQLDQKYPQLRQEKPVANSTNTIAARIEHLDLATVIKVSEAVSGEMDLEKLIDKLIRAAIQHAGAERGLLISPRIDELQVEAEATAGGEDVTVCRRDDGANGAVLPVSLVRYVMRTRETVLLDDALSQNPFSADPYIVQRRPRSILCLPLINQGRLGSILYLENNLASHVFAPDRVTVLKVLASQAAISLENTRLYRDLEDREGKIRRLVDSNIIGIFIWDLDGRVLEANEAFLQMVNYDREDLASGRIRWTDLTSPDWRARNNLRIEANKSGGHFPAFEKEYMRKDGTRVPVLVGGATFEKGGSQGVAYVLDLTERRHAQEEHEKLRQLESDLAHMNRLCIMGELAASMVHEITQPIATASNNARAAMNFLDRKPPDLGEVREALACVAGDTDRARAIIDRLRDHIKKAPPRKDRFDLNQAINEVVLLAQSAIAENGVSVRTNFAEELSPVFGDRVQLQQIVMNLILNAIEAMGSVEMAARELSIHTEQSQTDGVLVAVRDTGPGIDPQHVQRVFEAFYTTKSSGVGLGLSICRSIIETHGGRLWAEMNAPRGAVFQFTLPNAESS